MQVSPLRKPFPGARRSFAAVNEAEITNKMLTMLATYGTTMVPIDDIHGLQRILRLMHIPKDFDIVTSIPRQATSLATLPQSLIDAYFALIRPRDVGTTAPNPPTLTPGSQGVANTGVPAPQQPGAQGQGSRPNVTTLAAFRPLPPGSVPIYSANDNGVETVAAMRELFIASAAIQRSTRETALWRVLLSADWDDMFGGLTACPQMFAHVEPMTGEVATNFRFTSATQTVPWHETLLAEPSKHGILSRLYTMSLATTWHRLPLSAFLELAEPDFDSKMKEMIGMSAPLGLSNIMSCIPGVLWLGHSLLPFHLANMFVDRAELQRVRPSTDYDLQFSIIDEVLNMDLPPMCAAFLEQFGVYRTSIREADDVEVRTYPERMYNYALSKPSQGRARWQDPDRTEVVINALYRNALDLLNSLGLRGGDGNQFYQLYTRIAQAIPFRKPRPEQTRIAPENGIKTPLAVGLTHVYSLANDRGSASGSAAALFSLTDGPLQYAHDKCVLVGDDIINPMPVRSGIVLRLAGPATELLPTVVQPDTIAASMVPRRAYRDVQPDMSKVMLARDDWTDYRPLARSLGEHLAGMFERTPLDPRTRPSAKVIKSPSDASLRAPLMFFECTLDKKKGAELLIVTSPTVLPMESDTTYSLLSIPLEFVELTSAVSRLARAASMPTFDPNLPGLADLVTPQIGLRTFARKTKVTNDDAAQKLLAGLAKVDDNMTAQFVIDPVMAQTPAVFLSDACPDDVTGMTLPAKGAPIPLLIDKMAGAWTQSSSTSRIYKWESDAAPFPVLALNEALNAVLKAMQPDINTAPPVKVDSAQLKE